MQEKLKVKKNQKVLLRLDFNVPTDANGKIEESFRIDESIPTIVNLQKKGAKVIGGYLSKKEIGKKYFYIYRQSAR
jgi:3-phosphoglycerate kinase